MIKEIEEIKEWYASNKKNLRNISFILDWLPETDTRIIRGKS